MTWTTSAIRMLLILITVLAARAVPGPAAPLGASETFHIRFEATVGARPFQCGLAYSLGRDGATATPQYFRFYLSQVALIAAGGKRVPLTLQQDGVWQRRDVAFLSFEDPHSGCANGSPQLHTQIVGSAPRQRYTGIEFVLGVPDDLDHADATIALSPLNLSDMFWSWQDGYKFLRFDARVASSGRSASYILHVGSTGCVLSAKIAHCASPNRATVDLDGFDPAKNVIVADVADLFADADLMQLAQKGGCMSGRGDACQPVMRDLGVTFEGEPAAKQRLFRIR
ncbi:MAG TPA: MbnP family copper-binding protein [Candidatus Rubrimentiphilum sp.]|nr:MbnP family copper-binding protein [Candidatus Rubrimentiphilum sp.]